ncbi:alpha/beta hydrolase family protein [Paraburkholderia sp. J41]|uniref:alpha/beta hydrolase n=1 Tax=Paraburkholderia sp. J41 TaxID=2805433 RepID=UPI002AC32F68|nr:alpha/beta hydrolase family protein [Paraburkholderia sp. J41]
MTQVRTGWLVLAVLFGAFLTRPAFAFQTRIVSIPSAAMHQAFDATVVLPDDYARDGKAARYPVIYVLHGSGGNYADWTANTQIGRLADRYHVILVMPDGGHESWYIDSPFDPRSRYETYVGSEVVSYVDTHFRTLATRDARAITGLSMGGFGALRIALDRRDTFGAAGSISGAVDPRNCEDEPGISDVFGDPARHASFWNSNAIVENARAFEHAHIALTIDCGVSDFFVQSNRMLHEKLVELGVPHDYAERPGGHDWNYWANSIRYQVLFFSTAFQRNGWHPHTA